MTHKLLIIGSVFLLFGMISPLTAKFMPEILKMVMETDYTMQWMDLSLLFANPAAIDSWAQFYGNVGQMGLFVLVIVFCGMLSSEMSKGTLTIILTKGLARSTVILSKLSCAVLIWTICLCLSYLTSLGYTAYLFPNSNLPNLFFALFCLWVFGVFLLALTTFAATLTEKSFICMLTVGSAFIALSLVNIIPNAGKYNPVTLISSQIPLINEALRYKDVYPALAAAGIGIAALTLLAIISFNKKKAGKKPALLAFSVLVCLSLTVFFGEDVPERIRLNKLITSEKVTIGAGTEWELAGILTLPKNAEGKVPAVVLVHGSGAQDMDEKIFENRPFREIAEYLSSNGTAVIRYNKRTFTHGKKMTEQLGGRLTVWEETIEDAIRAAELLKSDPRINRDRVYILGHSLGGMLAPRIHAMGGDYAGLILFAGSPRFLLDIMKDQQAAVIETMEDENKKTTARETNRRFIENVERGLTLSIEEAKNITIENMGGTSAYYFKDLYENPASKFIENITAPFLVMHAADDIQVYTDKDFGLYKELLSGRSNVTFKLYGGLNHLFMPSTGRDITKILDEYRIPSNIDRRVLSDIAEWITADK